MPSRRFILNNWMTKMTKWVVLYPTYMLFVSICYQSMSVMSLHSKRLCIIMRRTMLWYQIWTLKEWHLLVLVKSFIGCNLSNSCDHRMNPDNFYIHFIPFFRVRFLFFFFLFFLYCSFLFFLFFLSVFYLFIYFHFVCVCERGRVSVQPLLLVFF